MASASDLQAASLLVRQKSKIDTLTLDVSITETHTGETEVTDHPVETGFNVTDHARPKPDVLTMEGIVSNTPLPSLRNFQITDVQTYAGTIATTQQSDQIVGQPSFAEQAAATLRTLRENPKLITVQTSLRTYTNMLMTSLVIPRSSSIGDAFRFTAIFKLVRVVSNQLTAAQATKVAPKKTPTGKQTGKKTDPSTDKGSSVLYDAAHSPLLNDLAKKITGSEIPKGPL